MTKAVVAGVAGFVGSHLAERLLDEGFDVAGIDCFTDYYDPEKKRRNLRAIRDRKGFRLFDLDLRVADLGEPLDAADHVVFLGGQPGVRTSWGRGMQACMSHNVAALGNVLDQCRARELVSFVVASSSSVYGDADRAVVESRPPSPLSPYGVSKVAAEALCALYTTSFGLPTVVLRYFTVYGPRQRPDMLVARLVDSALGGPPVTIFGDGRSRRDFTYVADTVDATVAAMLGGLSPGTVLNVTSGTPTAVDDVIATVAAVVGRPLAVEYVPAARGDVHCLTGATERARLLLGWRARTTLADGIATHAAWSAAERSHAGRAGRAACR